VQVSTPARLPSRAEFDPYFRLAVNTVVARILRSGQIMEIYERWFAAIGKPSPLLVATWASNSLPD
jgi:ABC-type amino acid transport substrate-binding protein